MYEHLEKARPDWFTFPASTNRCRLPGCPRYGGAAFREVHHLARHLQNPFHWVVNSTFEKMQKTSLAYFGKKKLDEMAPFQSEETILFT